MSTPPPDNINPSYITVNPDGTISANFSGVVMAQGVTLPEYSPGPAFSNPNAISWTPGGSLAPPGTFPNEWIEGQDYGAGRHVLWVASEPDFNDYAILLADSTANGNSGQSVLWVSLASGGGSIQLRILDDSGKSDFMRVANNLGDLQSRITSISNLGIKFGIGSIVTALGHAKGTGLIAHGLGTTPRWSIAWPIGFEGLVKQNGSPDGTNLNLQIDVFSVTDTGGTTSVTAFTAGGTWSVGWLAIA